MTAAPRQTTDTSPTPHGRRRRPAARSSRRRHGLPRRRRDRGELLDEVAQTIYYTSAGLPGAHQRDRQRPTAARRSTSRWSAPTGRSTKLDLTLGEVVPSTDPTSRTWRTPRPTTAGRGRRPRRDDRRGGRPRAVHRSDDVGRLVGAAGGAGRRPRLRRRRDGATAVVDWRTGEVSTDGSRRPWLPDVRRRPLADRRPTDGSRIVDVDTGDVLFEPRRVGFPWRRISPDGRFATIAGPDGATARPSRSTTSTPASHVTVEGPARQLGWTAGRRRCSASRAAGSSMCSADHRSLHDDARCPTGCRPRRRSCRSRAARLRELRDISRRTLSISSRHRRRTW